LTQVNVKIKVVIITVLKLDLGVDQAKARVTSQDGQPKSSQVNIRIKTFIIIVLKHSLRVNTGQDPGYESRGLTQVDPSQYKNKNKNNYYHNFKTRLGVQPRARPKSRDESVNSG
jgi:hypothetical protein